MRNGRTMLGLTAIALVAVVGCGSSSHKSTGPRTAPASTAAGTISSARTSARVIPAVVVRPLGGIAVMVKLTLMGHQYFFNVDTGAASTIVDATVAKALTLPHRGAATLTATACGKSPAQPVAISDWKLGGVTLPAATGAAIAKLPFTGEKFHGVPYGGQLDADVLSRFGTMTLDFSSKRLIVGGKPPSGGHAIPVKITRLGTGVFVLMGVKIHARPIALLVDTGAYRSVLDSRAAKPLGLQAVGKRQRFPGAGCSATATQVRIEHWTAGGTKMPTTIALSTRESVTDFFKGKVVGQFSAPVMATFGKVTIDFAHRKMVLGGTAG